MEFCDYVKCPCRSLYLWKKCGQYFTVQYSWQKEEQVIWCTHCMADTSADFSGYMKVSHSSDIQKLPHYIPLVPMDLLVQMGLRFLEDPEQKHMPSWTEQDAQLIKSAKIHSIWDKMFLWERFKHALEMGLTQLTKSIWQDKSDNKPHTENMHFQTSSRCTSNTSYPCTRRSNRAEWTWSANRALGRRKNT